MNITIIDPNGPTRSIPVSQAMEAHFAEPINHGHTILKQINGGMYSRWFNGKKDLVVMDFGANVGLTGLYFLSACKKLICVEPTPSHYALAKELLVPLEREPGHVAFSIYALTGSQGEFQFATGHSTENKVTTAEGYGNHKITVTGETLNYFLHRAGEIVDFCKIDIEGGEMMALTPEQIELSKGKVRCFFVEVHPAFGGSQDGNTNKLVSRFEQQGYKTERINFETFIATYDC